MTKLEVGMVSLCQLLDPVPTCRTQAVVRCGDYLPLAGWQGLLEVKDGCQTLWVDGRETESRTPNMQCHGHNSSTDCSDRDDQWTLS